MLPKRPLVERLSVEVFPFSVVGVFELIGRLSPPSGDVGDDITG